MRRVLLVAAATALVAGVAQAKDAADADRAAATRVLQVCSEDDAALRSLSRDLIPEFVTAERVRADAASGKAWSGPKCITPAELRRLKENPPTLSRASTTPDR